MARQKVDLCKFPKWLYIKSSGGDSNKYSHRSWLLHLWNFGYLFKCSSSFISLSRRLHLPLQCNSSFLATRRRRLCLGPCLLYLLLSGNAFCRLIHLEYGQFFQTNEICGKWSLVNSKQYDSEGSFRQSAWKKQEQEELEPPHTGILLHLENWKRIQNIIQDSFFLVDLIAVTFAIKWYDGIWYQWLMNTALWQIHINADGSVYSGFL